MKNTKRKNPLRTLKISTTSLFAILLLLNNQSIYVRAVTCGDGVLESPEDCDDGNKRNGDG